MSTPIDVADLERRVRVIERALSIPPKPVDFVDPTSWPPLGPPEVRPNPFVVRPDLNWPLPTKTVAHCTLCGMSLSQPSGYACGALDCPTQPRITA